MILRRVHVDVLTSRLQWLARVMGLVLTAVVLGVFVGNLAKGNVAANVRLMTVTDWVLAIALATMLAGFVLAWRWTLVGGAITFSAALAFVFVNLSATGVLQVGAVEGLFAVVGGLFMLCDWLCPAGTAR